jgi:transcriptional regulator with XRE-family HTH domain
LARSDAPRRHILREYQRARARGITQREFAEATGISSPRYLRKIIAGERSGKVIEKRAEAGGVVTVTVRDQTGEHSTNVRLAEGTSRLHIFRPSVQQRVRAIVRQQVQTWRARYAGVMEGMISDQPRRRFSILRLRKPKQVGRAAVGVIAI